ncbi:MAG: cobalt-precorrin-4/precorrin-4 C(11)-methyltransferase [Methanoregulaceae archaeon]|nr:cobalt-precorrin-4/precorrin-4 C(11)-methyltransferase [Methanoregulaceae archaeon]
MGPCYFVGAGPGDPGLITVRGMALLESADVLIYAGSLVNPELVALSPAPVKLNSWGMKLAEITDAISRHIREGKQVVRLHSGDPSLYGAIVEQMEELDRLGIRSEIVPGVSSMFGAAAALGTQLTLGGVSDTLIVTRPAGATLEHDYIRELSALPATMVVFLGTAQLEDVLSRVGYPPETPAAVVYHATWPDELVVRGCVRDIAAKARSAGIARSALLIIGGVVEPGSSGRKRSVLYS